MSVTLKLIGIDKLKSIFAKRKKKLDRLRIPNLKAVTYIDRWIQKNFESQGKKAYPGRGWQPLKAATIKRRRQGKKKSLGFKILQDTGRLKTHWRQQATQREGWVRSGVIYGRFHEEGTKHLPKRKILPTRKQILPAMIKIFKRHVNLSIR